ncbi:MAG: transposase [Thermodesulfobacteriota bacterium]|nr:transposase [Thermodesulfobacteriota bacterium]
MPRQARLDAPGLLQHVMARGIERRKIFWDDKDRSSFLERLAVILEKTQTQCYAWALIPNHFHLLLRTGQTPLSKVMRRLMTGYAVTFNKRHKRSGHLFQNRYKSIVCEEDQYLLELIRYIHLNPLRAGLVKDLKELDKYPWTGHSAIMGKRKNSLVPCLSPKNRFTPLNFYPVKSPNHFTGGSEGASKGIQLGPEEPEKYLAEKTIEDVLLQFGDKLREARRRYRQFVKEGIAQGTRPELQGGGLVRSAGGNKKALLRRKKEEWELSDERILGSGNFVTEILEKSNELQENRPRIPLEQLANRVIAYFGIKIEDILGKSQKSRISTARSVICYFAIKKMGYSGISVGKFLKIKRYSALRCAERGKRVFDTDKKLWDILQIK